MLQFLVQKHLWAYDTIFFLDPGKFLERRVSMGSRILSTRTMEVNSATPRVCPKEGHLIRAG